MLAHRAASLQLMELYMGLFGSAWLVFGSRGHFLVAFEIFH